MHRTNTHAGSTTLTPVDLRLLHSKLAVAVAATAGGLGMYVGDAMLVRAAGDYIAEASDASRDAVPTRLRIGFNPVADDGAVSAYTTGLTSFGLREFEVRRSARPAAEVRGAVGGVRPVELPGGEVASTTHRGPYGALGAAHAAVIAWCRAHSRTLAGPRWEVYGHWTEGEVPRTDIYYLLRPVAGHAL